MKKLHLHWFGHLAWSVLLLLGACGGHSEDVTQTTSSPPAVPAATQLAQASSGAPQPQWSGQVAQIFEDPFAVGYAVFGFNRWFDISTAGEAFLGWYRTHKTADGQIDGTAVNVSQYDASTQSWRMTEVAVVPFASGGGGFIYNLQMMALPHGDMVLVWDVVNTSSTGLLLTAPQFYFSRYSAQQGWGTPRSMDVSYGPSPGQASPNLFRTGRGWAVYPAGQGRVMLLWESLGQLYASFYVAAEDRWLEPENVGEAIGYRGGGTLVVQDSPAPLVTFNPAGTGVVQLYGYRGLYFDAASHRWSTQTFLPDSPSDAGPYPYPYYGHPLAVDEDGNVFIARATPRLELGRWSPRTQQTEIVLSLDTQPVDTVISLVPYNGGMTMSWYQASAWLFPYLALLTPEGTLKEPVQQLQLGTEGERFAFSWHTEQTDGRGRSTFVWRVCQPGQANCADTLSRTYTPGQGLSAPEHLQMPLNPYWSDPVATNGIALKVNAQGKGALFQVQLADLELRVKQGHAALRVNAKVLQ